MAHKHSIQMAVFDWAGTTVDYGSLAPSEVFSRVFAQAGITLSRQEIDRPMGMEKKAHIRTLLSGEAGSAQWQARYGRAWTEADVNDLYETFEGILYQVVADYSAPIPGVVDTVAKLRELGLKIGSTTGYNSRIMEQVAPRAAAAGYSPDCVVTPDVVGSGRPGPFMLFECMRRLQVYPPCAVVKVGDTAVDIQEGKNAGAWSIGVLTGSSLLGLSQADYAAMEPEALAQRKRDARGRYLAAGADVVIDNITELPAAIAMLNRRMAEGR